MAYTPSLADISNTAAGSYKPSVADIEELSSSANSQPALADKYPGIKAFVNVLPGGPIASMATNQFLKHTSPNSTIGRLGRDVIGGDINVLGANLNLPHQINPSIPEVVGNDVAQQLGVQNPGVLDKGIQGAGTVIGNVAGFMGGGVGLDALRGAAEGLPIAGKVSQFLGGKVGSPAMRAIGGSTNRAIGSAGYGAITNPDDRAMGAAEGAALSGGADAIGKGAELVLSRNARQNAMLDYLNKQSEKGLALSPEDAAKNQAQNYTNAAGNQVPVDIGTLTNQGTLKNTYQNLSFIPGAGVKAPINQAANQLADKNVTLAQQQLAESMLKKQNTQNQLDTLRAQNPMGNTQNVLDSLNNEITTRTQQLGEVPKFFNSLADGVDNRANITQELKGSVKGVYKDEKDISKELYSPINNSNLRLDQLGVNNPFPNYTSSATELLAKKENFENLFDTDADLGTKLKGELSKAEAMIKGGQDYGVTLPEAVTRIQNLGNLGASATSQGKRYEGMLLNNLRDSLSTDLDNTLRQSGNGNVADTLQIANSHHKNNIIPFYSNNEIRKAVMDKSYIPQQAKLAKALHDPNNQSILSKLSRDDKNAALYQLMTGGKGDSAGFSNMTHEDIGNAYKKLPVDAKTVINQYNPMADQLFESLPSAVQKVGDMQDKAAVLSKTVSATTKARAQSENQLVKQLSDHDKSIAKLQAGAEKAVNKKYGANQLPSSAPEKALAALKALLVPAGAAASSFLHPSVGAVSAGAWLGARSLAKDLNDTALAKAYISGKSMDAIRGRTLPNRIGKALYKPTAKAIIANLLNGNN